MPLFDDEDEDNGGDDASNKDVMQLIAIKQETSKKTNECDG
jgi:hypothetical protein